MNLTPSWSGSFGLVAPSMASRLSTIRLPGRGVAGGAVRCVPQDGAAALEIAGVSLAFGGVAALCDVSLIVMPGEIRAVIGPNGAGKSSLLNVVTGVYRPQAGSVSLGGHVHAQVPTARLASLGVGRTFQNLALFNGLTVLDNVAAGCSFLGRAGLFEQLAGLGRVRAEQRETLDRARQAIAFFHLDDYAGQKAGTLPYGLQKRVELARAMVAHPHLLLLDEPMAGMVRADKQELTRYIRTLRDSYGTAIVLIEHDVGVVMDLSDRIAVLDHGRKIADGTPSDIAADQGVIDAYLGVAHDEPDSA
jgi:branched-chain amino acid transport system ATP-binding protein